MAQKLDLTLNLKLNYRIEKIQNFHLLLHSSICTKQWKSSFRENVNRKKNVRFIYWSLFHSKARFMYYVSSVKTFNRCFSVKKTQDSIRVWGPSFSTYAKFSEKLTFLVPWYTHVGLPISGSGVKKCYFFGKYCVRTKWMILLQAQLRSSYLPFLAFNAKKRKKLE